MTLSELYSFVNPDDSGTIPDGKDEFVVVCCYHKRNFGFVKVKSVNWVDKGKGGVSHGMCQECYNMEKKKLK